MRVSIDQKAKIAELVEGKARLKTQQAEMEIQRIKKEHNIRVEKETEGCQTKHQSTEDGCK